MPLAHPPGHAQVDFGEAVGVIGGVRQKMHVFYMDLPHSDAPFMKAYPAETTEAFLDGHVSAFAFFGGVPLSILYDNTKLAVAKICGDGTRERTRAFTELVSHYLFADRFGRPGKGNDKGKVEGLVKYGRRQFLTPVPIAESYDALNAKLAADCRARQADVLGPPCGDDRRAACTPIWPRSGISQQRRSSRARSAPRACRRHRLVRYRGNDYSVPTSVRLPRGGGEGLRRGGRDPRRRERDRPASAVLRQGRARVRSAALSGADRAEARRARSGGAVAGLGSARAVRSTCAVCWKRAWAAKASASTSRFCG